MRVLPQGQRDCTGVRPCLSFRPYSWGGPFEPDLKRIVCQHCRTVKTAQSIGFILSAPNIEYYILNG